MKLIEIRAEAELDIIEAALWYEDEREGFGAEFSLEVERSVARIAENPLMFQEREMGMRMAKVGRFPYGLYFVDEFDKIILYEKSVPEGIPSSHREIPSRHRQCQFCASRTRRRGRAHPRMQSVGPLH